MATDFGHSFQPLTVSRSHLPSQGSCVSLSACSFGVNPRPGCSVNFTVPRDGFGGSRKIISRYLRHEKVRAIFQDNIGLNATNNVAIRRTNGRYVLRLDADDYLHTNALELLAGVLDRLKEHSSEEIVLCSVVLAELWFGAERSDATHRAKNYGLIDGLAGQYQSLPFDNAAAREYAKIRQHLSALGQPIGPNDTMIAAIARSRGVTLVTDNTTEFNRVPGLHLVNWKA